MIFDNLLKIVIFLVVLSILILVHEFGHFIVGRLSGVGVLEFALGLPFTKPLWSRKNKQGMEISLYPVLFGGFVRLLGEEAEENKTSNPNETNKSNKVAGEYFYQKPVPVRIVVVVAGVVMNLVLAVFAFYVFLGFSNFKALIPRFAEYGFLSPHQNRTIITGVQKGTPAAVVGIKPGSIVESADSLHFSKIKDFQAYVKSRVGDEIVLVLRDIETDRDETFKVTPRLNPPPGQGALGVSLGEGVELVFQTPVERATSGLYYSADMFLYNFKVLGHLAGQALKEKTAAPITDNVSGPVGIYSVVGDIVDIGGRQAILAMINFLGIMSLSLAFMNVLPIPAMDGGKLFLLLIEGIVGKKLSARNENRVNQVGFGLLLVLMVLISLNDILKFFKR
jgi:regulator of sigma E protease